MSLFPHSPNSAASLPSWTASTPSALTSGLPAEIAARQKQYEYYRDKLLTFKKREG